jgi:hypothetical protein
MDMDPEEQVQQMHHVIAQQAAQLEQQHAQGAQQAAQQAAQLEQQQLQQQQMQAQGAQHAAQLAAQVEQHQVYGAQQAAHIEQQQAQLEQLHHVNNQWQAGAANAAAAGAAPPPAPGQGPPGHEGVMPRGYRPEGLPKYYGKTGDDLEAWLFQVEDANRLFPITDEHQRVRYVALSLRDTAAKWYSAMQMTDPPQITGWETFLTKLRQQFKHLDQKWLARNAMHTIRQTGSVRDYSVKFRNLLLLIPDMTNADALDRYIRGLKDFPFKVWRRKFDNLEEAVGYAEELDLEIQQKQQINRGLTATASTPHPSARTSRPRTAQHAGGQYVPWQSRQEPRNQPRGGPTPMELGMLRDNPPHMDDAERARHMKDDLCFYCHKAGHRANRCPQNMGQGNGERRR